MKMFSKYIISAVMAVFLVSGNGFAKEKDGARKMEIKIGNTVFNAVLEDNATAQSLLKKLPMSVTMTELNGNEKYYYMPSALPSAPESIGEIKTGDIMLFQDNYLVLFYKTFRTSYRYTKIGRIENSVKLENAVGRGDVVVSFFE